MSLVEELEAIATECQMAGVEYAICGGLALSIHGNPRMTFDIDILVQPDSLESISAIVNDLGYTIPAMTMAFNQGMVEMKRFSKIVSDGSVIPVDLILVSPVLQPVWDTRAEATTRNGVRLQVASKEGLITMKSLSTRPKDQMDIDWLQHGQ